MHIIIYASFLNHSWVNKLKYEVAETLLYSSITITELFSHNYTGVVERKLNKAKYR